MPGAWTTYTPTWTATTTNPNAASHTVTARYIQVGKVVHFTLLIIFGSANFGQGLYRFTVPVTAQSSGNSGLFVGQVSDANVAIYPCHGVMLSTTTFYLIRSAVDNAQVGHNTPFTFGSNDSLSISGTYEAA